MTTSTHDHGPPNPGPTLIEIPGKTALLLAELGHACGAATPGAVVAEALGLLQTLRHAKSAGHRILVRDPQTGREIDLVV